MCARVRFSRRNRPTGTFDARSARALQCVLAPGQIAHPRYTTDQSSEPGLWSAQRDE